MRQICGMPHANKGDFLRIMTQDTKKKLATSRLLCFAIPLIALLGGVLSGCSNSGGGAAGMSDKDAKKFETRVDPNNPPPEAAAAMARMRAKSGEPAANAPVNAPAPK